MQHVLIGVRLHDYEAQGLYSNPVQYYDFLQNRVMILFRPKFEEADAEHPEFHLTLSKKQNYDIVRDWATMSIRACAKQSTLDVCQGRRKVGLGPHQATLHDNTCVQRLGEAGVEAIT